MKNPKLAALAAGVALAAVLAGCSTTYNPPPQEHVAVVTPPVVAISPQANPPTFHSTIGMTPTDTAGVLHLQSFAGDVCVQDRNGNAAISHCVCQQTNCNCQSTDISCKP